LDVSELLSSVIAACENEDELGCVLRVNFAFERLAEFYITHSASPQQIRFIENTNEFGES
jgi:hypothetical protein